MVVFEEMRAAVQAAAPDKLATIMSAIAQAYGAGGLTDEQYEILDGLLAARRRVAHAVPLRVLTLSAACAQLVPVAAPASAGQGTAPARAHHRTGSRPRSAESAARRRRWAAAGYLPPRLATAFTPGEQAVLAVVAIEIGKRGTCTLAVGHMAALAGVCATVAKRALRQARMLGLITVEERRLTGFRNDTNVIRVASSEWAGWLRLRMPRASHTGLRGVGARLCHARISRFSEGHPQAAHRLKTGALQLRIAPPGLRRVLQAPDPAAALAWTASGRPRLRGENHNLHPLWPAEPPESCRGGSG